MTRREALGWVWVAALGLAALAVCAVIAWAALPRDRGLPLGPVRDFPTDKPDHRALTNGVEAYLVNLNGTPVAWDARAAVVWGSGTRCSIRWVPTNNRFEDPCSGAKWCLDGTIADSRIPTDRMLDRYALDVDRDGNAWLRPSAQATGLPPQAAIPTSTASDPNVCD